jgi:predicted adenylyl cyclase CyaB
MRNVEIKAVCRDLAAARRVAASLGARSQGSIHQVDTYFRVPLGRLKLRQATPGPDQLVFYHRPDDPQPKISEIQMVEVAHAEALCSLLAAALGVVVRVVKERELWLLDNVRIHLDTVEGLGTFVEFEVMVTQQHPEASCHARAEELLAAFGMTDEDLIAGSYADLLARTST